jgi:hypothetical protein
MEAEREQSSSAKTIKPPRGKPPKVAKVNSWNTKKARTKR